MHSARVMYAKAALLQLFVLVASVEGLSGRDCVQHAPAEATSLCVGRAEIVQVGQNTSIDFTWETNVANSTDLVLAVIAEKDTIITMPSHVTIQNGSGQLVLKGVGAGSTVVSFVCVENTTELDLNSSCPISEKSLNLLRREVSFFRSYILEVISVIVGWTYTLFWVVSFYPQKFHNCKRGSVAGLNFTYVGLCFTSNLAYLLFNVGLSWIPIIRNEYFRRHPEGINPVRDNDVAYSICASVSMTVWVFQCFILKREGQRLSVAGALFIGSLWLLMFSCVVVSASGLLPWLDAFYIISYVTIIGAFVKYIPLLWTNFRRKTTEGFSPYTTMLGLAGGLFSIIQMLTLAYNYDDWKSIYGDPTKFLLGLITIGCELLHLAQRYAIFRGAKMREYELPVACQCDPGSCKCKVAISRRKSIDKVADTVALPDGNLELKGLIYV